MKEKMMTGVAMLLMMGVLLTAFAGKAPTQIAMAEAAQPRLVNVTGEGEVVVTPDIAMVHLGVETKNAVASKAQQENARLMTAVIAAIEKNGVQKSDIQTSGYSLYQTRDYVQGKETPMYYVARNQVEIKIKDTSKVGAIIDAASAAGANQVNSIRFTVSDDSVYYEKALKMAMDNAKSKATALMSAFGKAPGLPYSVSENSSGGAIFYDATERMMKADAAMETTPVESGEITIRASVTVSYDY